MRKLFRNDLKCIFQMDKKNNFEVIVKVELIIIIVEVFVV